jgi:hypothetical protein
MIGEIKMNIRIIKIVIVLIILSSLITGCDFVKGKNGFEKFKLGTTFEECKRQLGNYKIEIDGYERMKIENYMELSGKQVTLMLTFTNELKIDNLMQNLDDYRLIIYSFSIRDVDDNYNRKIVEDFCKLFGEPDFNDFYEDDANDKGYRNATWKLGGYNISITDNTSNKAKSFILISFKLNDNSREKFKEYVKQN